MKTRSILIICIFIFLVFTSFACTDNISLTPTEIPSTETPLPAPTETSTPIPTPTQTITPDVVVTEVSRREVEMKALVQEYYDAGYLTSIEGEYIELPSYENDWAMIDRFTSIWYENLSVSTFVMEGHLSWSSAIEYPEPSGCGFVFGVSENTTYYVVFVDKDRIWFVNPDYYEVAKTRGSGRLNFSLPAEADFTLIVNNHLHRAFALVDDEFIGEYPISQDNDISGPVGYSILSGTNKDFGTRCKITEAGIWVME